MRRALLLLLLPFAACGGGSDNPATLQEATGIPACADIVGQTLTVEEWEAGCVEGNTLRVSGSIECDDGRTIRWYDSGWAYEGEPAQPTVDGAVPGDIYWTKCQGIAR